MAIPNPASVTIGADTISLPKVAFGDYRGEYASSDGLVKLIASSQFTGSSRVRRTLRLDHSKISADVFQPAINVAKSMSYYVVFDMPRVGYTNTEALDVYKGLKGLMSASSDSVVSSLLAGES